MADTNLQITDAEWAVMEAVWERDEQAAGDLIATVLQSRDWNHRTIRTLLARLVDKGAVAVRIDGNRHLYRASVSKADCVRSAAKSFRERFFAGDLKSLLLHFVEHDEISPEELEALRQAIADRESSPTGKLQSPRNRRRKRS